MREDELVREISREEEEVCTAVCTYYEEKRWTVVAVRVSKEGGKAC